MKLKPNEMRLHLLQYIANAEKLLSNGRAPSTICVEGEAGIAKTSLIKQIAQEVGYKLHQINPAMIDDLGHLIGFPEKQHEIHYEGMTFWVPAETTEEYLEKGATYAGKARMSYAVPEWLQTLDPEDKFILLLDDFTRASPMVMQAMMTIVEERRYDSWELPKNTVIILTTNPDNGEYNVASLDLAQKTRFRYVQMEFCVEAWAQWAEKSGLDGRCINFALGHPEMFKKEGDGIGFGKTLNARIMTKFFEDIGELDDFSKSLHYIQMAGLGSVGEGFTKTFITFINNKLDKLPNPQDLFKGKLEEALGALQSVCGNFQIASSYNPATSSIMATRLINFVIYGEHSKWTKDENQRTVDLMFGNAFSEDLKFHMAKRFLSDDAKKQSGKLGMIMQHPKISVMLLNKK